MNLQTLTPDYRLIKVEQSKTMCRLVNGTLQWRIYTMCDGTVEAYQIVIPYRGAIPTTGVLMDADVAQKADWTVNVIRTSSPSSCTATLSTTRHDYTYPLTGAELKYIKDSGYAIVRLQEQTNE